MSTASGLLAAPIHPRGEVDQEVVEADRVFAKVHGQPDVFAARDALGRVDALAHHVGDVGGQIEAATGERIVLEDLDRVVRLRDPVAAQLADFVACLRWSVDGRRR